MEKQYLDAIRKREKNATPGPWEADYNRPFSNDFVGIFKESTGYILKAADVDEEDEDEKPTRPVDASFIAHARTDIPALLEQHDQDQSNILLLAKALELAETQLASHLKSETCFVKPILKYPCNEKCLTCLSDYFLEQAKVELDAKKQPGKAE